MGPSSRAGTRVTRTPRLPGRTWRPAVILGVVLLGVAIGVLSLLQGSARGFAIAAGAFSVGVALALSLPFEFLLLLPLVGASWLPLPTVLGRTVDDWLVVFFLVIAGVRLMGRVRSLDRAAKLAILACGLLACASLVAAVAHVWSDGFAALRFFSYALVVLGCLTLSPTAHRRLVIGLHLVVAGVAVSVLLESMGALPLLVQYADREAPGSRAGGLIGHPNFAAGILAIGILQLVVATSPRGWRRYALLGLYGSAILLTGSRGAFLALGLALLLCLPRFKARLIPMAAVLGIAYLIFGSLVAARLQFLAESGGVTGANAAGWRIDHWNTVLSLAASPQWIGVGWNRIQYLIPDGLGAHNGYLEVYVELGVLGCFALALLIAALASRALKARTPLVPLAVLILLLTISDPGLMYPPLCYAVLLLFFSDEGRPGIARRPRSADAHNLRIPALA